MSYDEDLEDLIDPFEEFLEGYDEFNRTENMDPKWKFQDLIIKEAIKFIKQKKNGTIHVATGGGKTRIANKLINKYRKEIKEDFKVLWVTKDWRLLFQAAKNYHHLFGDINDTRNSLWEQSRIGGNNKELTFLPEEKTDNEDFFCDVVYTTIHTFSHANNEAFISQNLNHFDLVIIDECHWGHSGSGYKSLHKMCKKNNIPMIGLSATPQADNFETIYKPITFEELVKTKVLSAPNVINCYTGTSWNPQLNNHFITQESYRILADNTKRNKKIIDTFNERDWGKTILFAINIDHANELYDRLPTNCSKYLLHSHMDADDRSISLKEFRKAKGKAVLVNVEMATTGIDIGDVKSIFVARPTTSGALYAQMVGRGSRYQPGKESFNLIEFTDNYENHEQYIMTADRYLRYEGGHSNETRKHPPKKKSFYRNAQFEYSPNEFSTYEYPYKGTSLLLPINDSQTFGFEIELTKENININELSNEEWLIEAKKIQKVLRKLVGNSKVATQIDSSNPDYSLYNVVYDGSCGWEIVSPILKDQSGINSVTNLFYSLESELKPFNFKVNFQTGFHLHLGYRLPTGLNLKNLFCNLRFIAPYLSLLVSPSRIVEFDGADYDLEGPNSYCTSTRYLLCDKDAKSLRKKSDLELLYEDLIVEDKDPRYSDVNFTNLLDPDAPDTIEIRLHNGTMDTTKVLCWISLWMQLLETMQKNDIYLKDSADQEIPIPHQEIYRSFEEVMGHMLNHSSDSFLKYLSDRKKSIWRSWKQNVFKKVA